MSKRVLPTTSPSFRRPSDDEPEPTSSSNKNGVLVELRLRDGKLTAVRDVLAASSVYFKQLFDDTLGSSTKDADGAYFISANVATMCIVLKYLETGKLTFAAEHKDDLIDLADMLCLENLLAEVRGGFNPFLLRDDVFAIRETERDWHRRLSCEDAQSAAGAAMDVDNELLVDVAESVSEFVFSSAALGSDLALLFDCRHQRLTDGAATIAAAHFAKPGTDAYRKALFRFADSIPQDQTGTLLLEQLDLTNVCIAGGAVLRVLLGGNLLVGEDTSDIDLFLVGLDNDGLMWGKVQEIFNVLKSRVAADYANLTPGIAKWSADCILVVRSTSAITFVLPNRRNVQIMLTRYSCVSDVLLNFDIDACQVSWHGGRVLCTPSAMRAINTRVILADPTIRHKGYESRLMKYALRGFAVAVPGLDVLRIAPQLLTGSWATYSGQLCRYRVACEKTASEVYGADAHNPEERLTLYSIGEPTAELAKLVVLSAYDAADFGVSPDYGMEFNPFAGPYGPNQLAAPLEDRMAPEELLFKARKLPGYHTIITDKLRGLVGTADGGQWSRGIRELDVSNHGHYFVDDDTKEKRVLFMDLERSSDGLGTLLQPGRPTRGVEKLQTAYAVGRIPPVVWDLVKVTDASLDTAEAALRYVSDAAYVPERPMGNNREAAATAFDDYYKGKLPRRPAFPSSHEAEFLQRPANDWFHGVYG